MIIKCGRREYTLDGHDRIMYNGHCYQIITQRVGSSWKNNYSPKIAEARFKKLLKDGYIVQVDPIEQARYDQRYAIPTVIYKVNEDKV